MKNSRFPFSTAIVSAAFIVSFGVFAPNSAKAQSQQELQAKLEAAQQEIDALKTQLKQIQTSAAQTKGVQAEPIFRPLTTILQGSQPVFTAEELAHYALSDPATLKQMAHGKIVAVTGKVDRFTEGFGRDFKIFFDTKGLGMSVGCSFDATSNIKSVHMDEDGAEMVVEDEKTGPRVFASVNDSVLILGFLDVIGRKQVSLGSCVLRHQ